MTAIATPTIVHDIQFERAIETARQNLPIKASIVAPEYLDGYKIIRRENPNGTTTFHVFDEDAWEKPSENPLLVWSAPVGEVVATVAVDGTVTYA